MTTEPSPPSGGPPGEQPVADEGLRSEDNGEDAPTSRGWIKFVLGGAALALLIAVVLVLVLVDFDKSDKEIMSPAVQAVDRKEKTRAELVTDFVNNITLTGQTLGNFSKDASLEQRALQFLIERDELNLVPNTTASQFRLQQRYAIATLWVQDADAFGDECDVRYGKFVAICQSVNLDGDIGSMLVITEIELLDHFEISPDLGLLSHLDSFLAIDERWIDDSALGSAAGVGAALGQWTNLKRFTVQGAFSAATEFNQSEALQPASSNTTSALPEYMRQWTRLEFFQVLPMKLRGSLPDWIGEWTNMEEFLVYDNALTGSLPSSIGRWSNLRVIQAHRNALTGTLPSTIENWTSLQTASLDLNNLTGSVPVQVCTAATNLTEFWVDCFKVNCTCSDALCPNNLPDAC